jgi:hypothetical protein
MYIYKVSKKAFHRLLLYQTLVFTSLRAAFSDSINQTNK